MVEVRLGDITIERLRPCDVAELSLSPRERVHVVSINLDHIHRFRFEPLPERGGRRNVYVADGWPVAVACRLVSGKSWPRCSGADYFPLILERAVRGDRPVRVYGSTSTVHAAARLRILRQFGAGAKSDVVSFDSPRPDQLTDRRHLTELAQASAGSGDQVVFVCLGKPKQEQWYEAAGDCIAAPAILPVGAALEFWSGSTSRAPLVMQHLGLEWCHRLILNPRRLWRRYSVEALSAAWRLTRAVRQARSTR